MSFMIFFRRLGHSVTNQHIVWWAVLAITAASYFVCIGDTDYRCLASSFAWIESGSQNFKDLAETDSRQHIAGLRRVQRTSSDAH